MVEKISMLCNKKKITIGKLENILGFGNGTIWKWKKSSPSVDKLKAVADYFGVNIEYFLEDDKEDS